MQPEPQTSNVQQYPLVSIALCVYNGEKFLREQLDSLVSQTYPNIEIVAVDDVSKDSSLEILAEYQERYPFFRVYENEANLGYVRNFEKAIRLCNGTYIALSDQDDIWHSDKISRQVASLGTNQLIYHDSAFMDEEGKSMRKNMSDIINLYRGDQPEPFYFYNCVSGHSILFRRELMNEFLPFHPEHFHDHWIAYVAVNLGTIDFIPEPLVWYRQHRKTSTDILNKRKKIRKYYHENRDIKKLRRDLKWIRQCATFRKNRNPELLQELLTLFEARLDHYFSFRFARFIRAHYHELFYIQKYKRSTRRGYIYRQIWGLKAKLIWAAVFGRREDVES